MSREARPAVTIRTTSIRYLISRKIAALRWPHWVAIGTAATVAIAVSVWALWPESPRQRVYLDATACLLTGNQGVTTEPAASVWATLQQASVDTLVRAQTLRVSDPQTPENAAGYLASLATSDCGLIVAVDAGPAAAVDKHAGTFPATPFITVGGGTPAANVQVFDPSDTAGIQAAVQTHLEAMADQAS